MSIISRIGSAVARRVRRGRPSPVHELQVDDGAAMRRAAHWASFGERLRMHVPVDRLVMQGALRYAHGHPFVQALRDGETALAGYYASRRPHDLCDLHGIAPEDARDREVPAWELPWIERAQRLPPPGEDGLGAEHGLSFYGPVSADKVALEMSRLRAIAASIGATGYQPDRFGDICGFFLDNDDGDFRFFVRGGKHRAAALVATGVASVPVAFKAGWPRRIQGRDRADWPLVAAGRLSAASAHAVFLDYFD